MSPVTTDWTARILIALAIGITLVSGCRNGGLERSGPPPRQAILILLDAARADRFGYAGYGRETTPHLDSLAKSGLVSLAHFAHDTHTRGSLPSLFYSRYFAKALFPTSDAVPYDEPESLMRRLDDEAISLSRLLADEGFATAAISAHSWLKPGTPFAREFEELIDLSAETRRYAPPAERVVDRALEWIGAHREDDYFLYLHLMDTHFPHAFGPEAKAFWGSGDPPPAQLDGRHKTFAALDVLDAKGRKFLDALYDGSLLHADREIERLSSYLASLGLDRDTLVVVTSDHGEHLLETPGRFAHGGDWLEPVGRIPLIFHSPSRLEAMTVPGFSGPVDVAPTMLRLLEVALPAEKSMDGRDLVAVARREVAPSGFAFSPLGVRSERYKLLVESPKNTFAATDESVRDQLVPARLFDLTLDARELHDVATEQPEVVRSLLDTYRDRLGPKWRRFANAANHTPPETPFAIGARYFGLDPGSADELGNETTPSTSQAPEGERPPRWIQSKHWRDDWIIGHAGAPPLEISFPLPDGEYEVVAQISGAGAIELPGSPPVIIVEAPEPERDRRIPLGRMEVRGERFSSRLHAPANSGSLRVRLLGFRPATALARSAEQEALHLEQLRALGYIE